MPPTPTRSARQKFVPAPPSKLERKRKDTPQGGSSPPPPLEDEETKVAAVPDRPRKRRRQPTLVGMPMPGTGASISMAKVTSPPKLPALAEEESTREVPRSSLDTFATDQVETPPDLPGEATTEVMMPEAREASSAEPAVVSAIEPTSMPPPAVEPTSMPVPAAMPVLATEPYDIQTAPTAPPTAPDGPTALAVPDVFDVRPLPPSSTHVTRAQKSRTMLFLGLGAAITVLIGAVLGAWVLLSKPSTGETVTQLDTPSQSETVTIADSNSDSDDSDDSNSDSDSDSDNSASDDSNSNSDPDVALPSAPTSIDLPHVPHRIERLPRGRRERLARRLRMRARSYRDRRLLGRAEDALMESLKYAPEDPTAHKEMALVRFRQGQLRQAAAWMVRAVELDPENDGYHVILGDIYGAQRDVDLARREWERAISLNRGNRQARRRLERLGRP
jgi:hypothetical protein